MSLQTIRGAVASKLGVSMDRAAEIVTAVATAIADNVGTDPVRVAPLGTFKVAHRAGRTGRNPATGETISIAARDVLVFKQSKKA